MYMPEKVPARDRVSFAQYVPNPARGRTVSVLVREAVYVIISTYMLSSCLYVLCLCMFKFDFSE